MKPLLPLTLFLAIVLAGTVGTKTSPAWAKKNAAGETQVVKKQAKRTAAKKCKRGPVPPFMRNPRFMNRGLLKNRC